MFYRLLLFFFLLANTAFGQIINEICPSNLTVIDIIDEGYKDWIEIHNNTGAALNLNGLYISDDLADLQKWEFPDMEVAADSYTVFAANDESENDSAISFTFRRKGGIVILSNAAGVIIDSLSYPELLPNDSYGRLGAERFYFDSPSPDFNNLLFPAYKGYADKPKFNRVSGVYQSGTNITLNVDDPSLSIYYSLNGTNPLYANSYTEPIVIAEPTSIRAVAIGDSLIASPAVYGTYFGGRRHKLPVVNLNIDSLELLDELLGIYVLGPDAEEAYPYYGANFWKDIEIHAYYEYFDEEMLLQESLDCGIKIHGGTISTTRPMKSLRLVAHDRYDKEEFTYPYFKNKTNHHFKRLLLRNSGSDFNHTHLKDGMLHNFILDHDLNVDAQGYHPVIVYINGMYWGIHNMREKLDKYYPASNYDIDPESVNLLEEEELTLIAGDSATFIALRDFALSEDLAVQANYDWVATQLDLPSMVDYFIMEMYVNNRDWPYNNLKLWNSADFPKWRYFYSDLDAGVKYYGTELIDFQHLALLMGEYGDNNVHVQLLKKLLTVETFRRYFINRYADLMNTILQADYLLSYIYALKSKLDPEMRLHFFKWYGVLEEWDANFLEYDAFFEDRVAIVRQELSDVFELEERNEVYVGMYPSDAGEIKLNTLMLDSFPFKGTYYKDNLIDFTVVPKKGMQFLHWENLRTGELALTSQIQVNPHAGDSIVAVFESLQTNYNLTLAPNPVNAIASLNFSIPSSGEVTIALYDLKGTLKGQLYFAYLAKGSYTKSFNLSFLSTGEYLIQLHTDNGTEAIQLIKI